MTDDLIEYKFLGFVYAGFPSPAADYMEEDIDLKKYLQPNPTAVYIARVEGDSMLNSNIPDQSIVVIDKSLVPHNGNIVIASLNGEKLIKQFVKTHTGLFLSSSNPKYQPIKISPDMEFQIWGVVTHVIVKLVK